MTLAVWFWLSLFLTLVLGAPIGPTAPWRKPAAGVLLLIALVALGWAVFGGPVQG